MERITRITELTLMLNDSKNLGRWLSLYNRWAFPLVRARVMREIRKLKNEEENHDKE